MNKEIQKKWVEALRSGKYRQGEESLWSSYQEVLLSVDDDGQEHWEEVGETYCCLGVLCQIVDPEWREFFYDSGMELQTTTLSDAVEHESGLDDDNVRSCLAGMNDVGYSFDQIATVIEETDLKYETLRDVSKVLAHIARNEQDAKLVNVKEVIHEVIGGF